MFCSRYLTAMQSTQPEYTFNNTRLLLLLSTGCLHQITSYNFMPGIVSRNVKISLMLDVFNSFASIRL
jgi:hypothetical protein